MLKAQILSEKRPDFSLLETILWTPEEGYFLLDHHLQRLTDSADYFDYRSNPEQIRTQLHDRVSGFQQVSQRVRLLVSKNGSVEIQAAPLIEMPVAPVRVGLAQEPVNSADIFLYHKTTLRSAYEAARRTVPDCEDVLLWNERRELTESCVANVVLEMDGRLLTPPVDSGLLPGTFRALIARAGNYSRADIAD